MNPPVSRGGLSVYPTSVLANQHDRLDVEDIGRKSVAAQQAAAFGPGASTLRQDFFQQPLPASVRQQALDQVDKDLVAGKLLTAGGGTLSPEAQKSFKVEITSCLPTPGVIVKGCIDPCDICEPALEQKIQLELEEQSLKNQLLKRQIELLDKAQEYRCCPAESTEEKHS
jgi:hypothetical protein